MNATNPATTHYQVLLIEDDFIDQENVCRSLKLAEQDFSVVMRNCLQDGVDALRAQPFDIILLDLSLPDSFGVDTINRMIEEFQETPIIVLSGSDDKELAKEAISLGVKDYLIKGETSGVDLAQTIAFAVELCRSGRKLSDENSNSRAN